MLPYFYPPENFLYYKQFPEDHALEFFPYDKEKEPAFVALLKMAMKRGAPLTKVELIEAYGEELYGYCMFPEKRGFLSFEEERAVDLFCYTKKRELKGKQELFEEYSNIVLDVLESRKKTRDLGLYFGSLLEEYIKKSPFFKWKKSDLRLFKYMYANVKGKKLNRANTSVSVLWSVTYINTRILVRYLHYGKSIL